MRLRKIFHQMRFDLHQPDQNIHHWIRRLILLIYKSIFGLGRMISSMFNAYVGLVKSMATTASESPVD